MVVKKDLDDYFGLSSNSRGKANKTKDAGKDRKKNLLSVMFHSAESLKNFSLIEVSAPTTFADISKVMKVLQERKIFYQSQERGAIPTIADKEAMILSPKLPVKKSEGATEEAGDSCVNEDEGDQTSSSGAAVISSTGDSSDTGGAASGGTVKQSGGKGAVNETRNNKKGKDKGTNAGLGDASGEREKTAAGGKKESSVSEGRGFNLDLDFPALSVK